MEKSEMRNRFPGLTFALLVALAPCPAIFAQTAPPPKAKTQAAATPDLSGVWRRSRTSSDKTRKHTIYELAFTISDDVPPMTPWAEAKYKANLPNLGPRAVSLGESNDPIMQCFPPGVPRAYLIRGEPIEIVQIPGRVLMIYEYDHFIRNIFTDGRSHPADPNPSWMGDSVATWEGDTLVVDTIGFNDKTWLDNDGHPHSEDLHLEERIRRASHDALKIDVTIDDSKAYTKSWTAHWNYELKPGWNLGEMICEDNGTYSDMQQKSEGGK
jgi:hypothetical protein